MQNPLTLLDGGVRSVSCRQCGLKPASLLVRVRTCARPLREQKGLVLVSLSVVALCLGGCGGHEPGGIRILPAKDTAGDRQRGKRLSGREVTRPGQVRDLTGSHPCEAFPVCRVRRAARRFAAVAEFPP